MDELFIVRIFGYSFFPLLLALGHILLDKQVNTTAHRIEIVMMYLFAISVGANGLGGGFGHLFLSDLVAEGVGWDTGSPFQLEMGFTNLAIGLLGIVAMSRGHDFRLATIIVVTIVGGGATVVHLIDIVSHGNLAPGNTIQNIANLLDPILLIVLTIWASRLTIKDTNAFHHWQVQQHHLAGFAAMGIGIGFGMGFAFDALLLLTLAGGFAGVLLGLMTRRQPAERQFNLNQI